MLIGKPFYELLEGMGSEVAKRCSISSRKGSESIDGVIGVDEVGAGQVGEMRVSEL
jgi:hypothetical protein